MSETENIKELSNSIWNSCAFLPQLKYIAPFEKELQDVDFRNFIVYNYNDRKSGLALRYLLLSTFKFWKHFNNTDWKYIFLKLNRNGIAKYDLTWFCKQYIGYTPDFKSKNIAFREPISNEKLLKPEELDLNENFGLTPNELLEMKHKLSMEIEKLPKQKSIWERLMK